MPAARPLALITVTDYLAGELVSRVKHEYAAGYVYAMAGATNAHNTIAGNFFGVMFNALRKGPCQPFNSDTKVRIRLPTHHKFYYPDGMIVCDGNPPDVTYQDSPVVVAEVTSTSTRRTDIGEKREAYTSLPSLDTYLVIEGVCPKVTVHRRAGSGFETFEYEGLDAVIPLDAVGTTLALADLYERIDFKDAATEDAAQAEAF